VVDIQTTLNVQKSLNRIYYSQVKSVVRGLGVGVPLHGSSCRIKPHDGCFREIRDPEEGPKGVLEIRDPKAGPKGVSNFCKALIHGLYMV
jgi:hypothetical protein